MRTQFKIITRGLLKSKQYFFLSITVLFISFLFVVLLSGYIRSELSYDRSIPGYQHIYRVTTKVTSNGMPVKHTAKSQMPLGDALLEQVPGILSYTRILDEENLFRLEEIKLGRQKTYWVDETFPQIFSLEIIEGEAADALSAPFTGMISEEVAKRFFGNESPVGKVLIENEGLNMEIRGVFRKPEGLSHFDYDYLMSFATVKVFNGFQDNWDTDMFYTYIQTDPQCDINDIKKNLKKFADATYVNHHTENQEVELVLQSVSSIYLGSKLVDELSVNTMFSLVMILAVLGLVTLLVSLLNFSVMIAARYKANRKTLFVNRIYGSRYQLVSSIILESGLLISFAFLLAILCILLFGEKINTLLDLNLGTDLKEWPLLTGFIYLSSLVFSILFAWLLLSGDRLYRNIIYKDPVTSGKSKSQAALIIFQYGFSIVLIAFLLAAMRQIDFMKNTDPGYTKDRVMAIHTPRTLIMNGERISRGNYFFEELKNQGLAAAGCITSDLPGKPVHTDLSGFVWLSATDNPGGKIPSDWINIDTCYLGILGLKLLAGQNFHGDLPSNIDRIILNEQAVEALGFESADLAIGETVTARSASMQLIGRERFTITGVVADFHQEGLQESVKPMAFTYSYFYLFGLCALRVNDASSTTIAEIQSVWESLFPDDPFDYFFLDDRFVLQYRSEIQFFRLATVFGLVATLIACLGLYINSSEMVLKRRKEIGIRKVNGASVFSIIGMLNSAYVRWLIISFLAAIPFAVIGVKKWLEGFESRISLSAWIFFLAGSLVIIIAILTVSFQSWKAARMDPVTVLRHE